MKLLEIISLNEINWKKNLKFKLFTNKIIYKYENLNITDLTSPNLLKRT